MSTTQLIMTNPWLENSNTFVEKKFHVENKTNLKDLLAEIARRELREDDHTRRQCLEQFKDWIRKNQDIEYCITDDKFLLRFLRVKKFSIPMAQQTLLKYLNFRKRFRQFMYDLDFLDPSVSAIINNGYIFASPFRDASGRRVIIYNTKHFDPHKHSNRDLARAHCITYETIISDEENQILGVNHVGDVGGFTPAFLTLFSITEFATIIRWGEQSFPMRHKEVNVINMPAGLKYVYDFAVSNVKNPKLKDRCRVHNSLSDLHKAVNKRCLPLEMGGVMPVKDMLELWKEELAAKRDLLLSLDAMNLLSDRGIIRRSNAPAQDETGSGSLAGSFRKLELD